MRNLSCSNSSQFFEADANDRQVGESKGRSRSVNVQSSFSMYSLILRAAVRFYKPSLIAVYLANCLAGFSFQGEDVQGGRSDFEIRFRGLSVQPDQR